MRAEATSGGDQLGWRRSASSASGTSGGVRGGAGARGHGHAGVGHLPLLGGWRRRRLQPSAHRRRRLHAACARGVQPPESDLPEGFDCRDEWKLTDYAAQPGDGDYDAAVAASPHELFGVKGSATNRAWEVTTGRPDTVIAVLDSGIRWSEELPALNNKFYLNRAELPRPCAAGERCRDRRGGSFDDFDVTGDGVFNVGDYADDPRVADFGDDENDDVDPADLIRTFSTGATRTATVIRMTSRGGTSSRTTTTPATTCATATGRARASTRRPRSSSPSPSARTACFSRCGWVTRSWPT